MPKRSVIIRSRRALAMTDQIGAFRGRRPRAVGKLHVPLDISRHHKGLYMDDGLKGDELERF